MHGESLHLALMHSRAMVANNRWLPEHHHHPPLSAPVMRHSHKLNFYIGIVLVVFMAVSVVALICCCYHLEWRLRLQARNAARRVNRGNGILVQNAGSHEMITRAGKKIKQETNLSVMMPGDSIPSFLAKAKPHGSAAGADFPNFPASGAMESSHTLGESGPQHGIRQSNEDEVVSYQ